jgi:hypothetical protein
LIFAGQHDSSNTHSGEEKTMNNWFSIIPRFLRNPETFWADVLAERCLGRTTLRLGILTVIFLATYGFALGLSHSWMQALSSAVKMPLLLLAAMFFCLPALFVFSLAMLATPLKLLQVTAVVLAGVSVTAFILLGLAPVTLFFVWTSENYPFFQLLAVGSVAAGGFLGLRYLWCGIKAIDPSPNGMNSRLGNLLLLAWLGLYALVAAQLTWRLSPLVGDPELPFVVLAPSRDNFYVDVVQAGQRVMGGSTPRSLDTLLGGSEWGAMCICGVVLAAVGLGVVVGIGNRPGKPQAVTIPGNSVSPPSP